MEELIKGQWRVAVDGYRWVKAKAIRDDDDYEGRFLTSGILARSRVYSPFIDEPSLFIKLSELEPTEKGVVAFANLYGLVVGETIMTLEDRKTATGDRLKTWRRAIVTMRHALDVWNAIKEADRKKISRWFALEDHGDFVDIVYSPDEPWPTGVGHFSPQFTKDDRAWEFGDARGEPDLADIPMNETGAALAWLRMNVREHLRENASPSFLYLPESKDPVPLGLSIVPKNLLGVVWLQFARAIEGDVWYQRCLQCQRWFRVSTKARRPTTTFCSTNCRVKYHRRPKKDRQRRKKRKINA
jgi:hypothetical protein